MKEGLPIHNPIAEQKDLLSMELKYWKHERVIPLLAVKTGKTALDRVQVEMGYAIADDKLEAEALVLQVGPIITIPSLEWQGEKLKEKLGKRATVSPVTRYVHYADPVGPKEELVGWRIHTEDELAKEAVARVRAVMMEALSQVIDERNLEHCTDTELCLMMLLMENNDIQQVRRIAETHHYIRISARGVKDDIRTLVDNKVQQNNRAYDWNMSRGNQI